MPPGRFQDPAAARTLLRGASVAGPILCASRAVSVMAVLWDVDALPRPRTRPRVSERDRRHDGTHMTAATSGLDCVTTEHRVLPAQA